MNALGVEAHMLHADDLLAFMYDDGVPDGHGVSGQTQFVSARQRVITGERVGKSRNWLVKQVEDSALHGVPQWLRQGLDLIPGRAGKTDEAITH